MPQSVDTETSTQEKVNDGDEKEISKISEIIENSNINEGDKERIIGYMREEYRGPLPHPRILQQYDELQPGLAREIVNMALKEQEHRHEMEKALVMSEVSLNDTQSGVLQASIKLKTRLQLFAGRCFMEKRMSKEINLQMNLRQITMMTCRCNTVVHGKAQ
jgi:uncharacterized membrane protein